MRLDGEAYDGEEGEEEEQKLVVGYALTVKKKKSFLQPKFVRLARQIIVTLHVEHKFTLLIARASTAGKYYPA
ncbi:Inositol-tetrakisphosphate 1-kinase [Corchorus olitorius]|uniref:Inositol-tetrakisphosphate 1-kinase n=1 Tax=Corchorus olitorius TaxID=93759 RepID=A0A1R3GZC2_9ROSI|nr:Inositol-tetrakisphosphate 1-kinase [Corchorus olitorius]